MKNDYNSHDSGYIIKFILNQLNEELNINPIKVNENNDPMYRFNKELILKQFFNNIKENSKFISDKFYSIIEIKKRCTKCEVEPNTYEYFYEASPIIDINLEAPTYYNESFRVSLEEHLKILLIDKESQNIKESCILCGKEQIKIVSKDIVTTSEVLILNINRKNDINNIISFNYPEEFSGKKIINSDDKYNLPDYELTSVILKKKDSLCDVKYKLFYKNFIDNNWYSYNNEEIILVQNYKNYIFDDKNACVLIYTKKYN